MGPQKRKTPPQSRKTMFSNPKRTRPHRTSNATSNAPMLFSNPERENPKRDLNNNNPRTRSGHDLYYNPERDLSVNPEHRETPLTNQRTWRLQTQHRKKKGRRPHISMNCGGGISNKVRRESQRFTNIYIHGDYLHTYVNWLHVNFALHVLCLLFFSSASDLVTLKGLLVSLPSV